MGLQPNIPPNSDPQSFQTIAHFFFSKQNLHIKLNQIFNSPTCHSSITRVRITLAKSLYWFRNIVHVIRELLHFYSVQYALEKLLHFALKSYHIFVNFFITFCVNVITFCGDYYILKRNNLHVQQTA